METGLMLDGIRISKVHMDRLLRHAQSCLPLESAALLFGHLEGNIVTVTRVEPVDNALKSSVAFEVDPMVEYRLLQDAEARGEDMIGIFHSHPVPPMPSERDIHNMNLNPVVWLIASKTTGRWKSRAFLLDGAKVVEIPAVVA
jgi:proteasome lid subunit RPN8/RPN11